MSSEHTPGPWRVVSWPVNKLVEYAIRGAEPVATMARYNGAEANARRIVACVNACEGLPTETLEAAGLGKGVLDHLKAERDALREQIAFLEHFADAPDMKTGKNTRDILRSQNAELVEALSIIAGEPRQDDTYAGMDKVEIARSVLARVKP